MGVWDRSWLLAKTTFGVIKQDKEMLWFPVLSGFFSILFSVALLVPTFLVRFSERVAGDSLAFTPLEYAVLFVEYFGLAFIATFFNVCVVYTTRTRLSGGDATFGESFKFALSRIHLIAAWSLVSASVGLILRSIDKLAERAGPLGGIILSLVRFAMASAWSIVTLFVIPAMVYKNLGPIEAIKDSMQTLKQHWGESLVRHFGMGLAAFVCFLPALVLFAAGVAAMSTIPVLGILLMALGFLGALAVITVFNVANTVYNTALYHWAAHGNTPQGFDSSLIAGAFTPKSA